MASIVEFDEVSRKAIEDDVVDLARGLILAGGWIRP